MSTLANARDVLQLMVRMQRDLTVSEVTEALGAPKSSVSRTLTMMANYGFLDRDLHTKAYRPGSLVIEASYHFRGSRTVTSLLEDEVARLVDETGYTCYINMLDGRETMVTHMRTGTVGTLQAYTPVGTRGAAYASSMGRAILARLDDKDVTSRLDADFEPVGQAPRTVDDLLARLNSIRSRGWELSRGEFVANVAGISAAVIEPGGTQPLGIGIALPAHDFDDALANGFGPKVRDAAMRVGRKIGDPYWLSFSAD